VKKYKPMTRAQRAHALFWVFLGLAEVIVAILIMSGVIQPVG